jgi:hypothetical protein
MRQLEELRQGPGAAQLLDDAERDTAATVHSRASRLVDHDQGLVLVGNIKIPRWNSA